MTCRVSRPQTSWWWHKTPMTILRIGKLMTHLQRLIIHSTFGLSFCYRKWKQKIILASCCRHWSRNPLMLWESLEIPDTILIALWVRFKGAEWQLHQKSSKYGQFYSVCHQMASFASSLHLLPEPECWLLTIAMISIRPVSCPPGLHCAVIGFTTAWHDEYLPDLFVAGYRHSLIQFTVFS